MSSVEEKIHFDSCQITQSPAGNEIFLDFFSKQKNYRIRLYSDAIIRISVPYLPKDSTIEYVDTLKMTQTKLAIAREALREALAPENDTGDKYNDYNTLYYAIEQALAAIEKGE